MEYQIVVDSGCDLDDALIKKIKPLTAPLTLIVNNNEYKDDESLDLHHIISEMILSSKAPSSACPSPQDFYTHMEKGEKGAFALTISAALSGSYQSAVTAATMLREKAADKFYHVFDTKSAASGETLIMMKIHQLLGEGLSPENIITAVNEYIKSLQTVFMLDNLNNLAKAGRLNPIIAKLATVLNIKLVCAGDENGEIQMLHKVRGDNRSFLKLIKSIGDLSADMKQKDRILCISHCNAIKKAEKLREALKSEYSFKDIMILHTRGISTIYADSGGLVVAF